MKYTPYSYSKISCFHQCPKKFKFTYIDKIKLEHTQNIHLNRGNYLHEKLENYESPSEKPKTFTLTESEQAECNQVYESFITSKIGKEYLEKELIGNETKIAISKDFELTTYRDKNSLFKGKVDRINELESQEEIEIIDWKSGKYREQGDQLKYYALWGFIKYPKVNRIKCSFVFIEQHKEIVEWYTRDDINQLKLSLLKKMRPIEKEEFFMKKPSYLCNYCDFFKQGHCEI